MNKYAYFDSLNIPLSSEELSKNTENVEFLPYKRGSLD